MASTKQAARDGADMHDEMQALRDDLARLTKQVAGMLNASREEAIGGAKARMRQRATISTRPLRPLPTAAAKR